MADSEQRDPKLDAFDGKHLLIAEAPCDECLLSKNRLVSEPRKRQILKECYEKGTYFICHKATLKGRAVICHSFAKSTDGAGNVAIRVAQFFRLIRYVDPATGRPSKPARRKLKGT